MSGLFPFYRNALEKILPKITEGYTIDLGAGRQNYREFVKEKYFSVDLSVPADLKHDLNYPLPLENEICDTVLSLGVVNYLDKQQLHVDEAYRILRKGGMFLFGSPNYANNEHKRVSIFHLIFWAQKAGFEVLLVEPICYLNPKANMMILCKKED